MRTLFFRLSVMVLCVGLVAVASAQGKPEKGKADKEKKGKPAKSKGKVTVAPPAKWDKKVNEAFFADARKELVGERPDFGKPRAVAASGNPGAAAAATPAAGGGGFAWSGLISGEALESRIKGHIAGLEKNVKDKAPFDGGGNRQARKIFSELAVLFGVVAQYDGEVRWKDKGAAMREVMGKAGVNCKVATEGSWKEAKQRYTDLSEMIRGGSPSLPEPGDQAAWNTATERPPMMQVLESLGQEDIKQWTAGKAEFNAHKDKLLEEAQVVAVIAQVIQDASFDYADDAGYKGFCEMLRTGALDVIEGVKQNNFDQAAAGGVAINRSCTDCHSNFR